MTDPEVTRARYAEERATERAAALVTEVNDWRKLVEGHARDLEATRRELVEARAELEAALRKLRYVVAADRTRAYGHGEPRADGEPAPTGARWVTPREAALLFLGGLGRLHQ